MASFGENLRRERELRGITLAEVADATKIGLRYLEALESDEFNRLPGGIFNRGFVRAVARYLGLDEREWLGAFAQAAHEEPGVLARYAPLPPEQKPPSPNWRGFALLVLLFGAGLFAVHTVRARRAAETLPTQNQPKPATPPVMDVAPPAPATPALPAATAPEEKLAQLSLAPASEKEPGQIDLHLQVDAIEEAWVSVTGDRRTLYEGLMKSRETRVFRAASELGLRTGNASALVLTLNGETLAPLGNPGEIKSITLTSKDLAPLRP